MALLPWLLLVRGPSQTRSHVIVGERNGQRVTTTREVLREEQAVMISHARVAEFT